ncbi:MAG TPA: tRNA pseudouridine(38-40) synthase TruA [Bacteroidia bacterium]|nr:tRNA pseudouridine(38-40) synthase TruA [Bacteroidia bacterium]
MQVQRYFLQLTYKGTRYHGWQVQANALSVQAVLDAALSTFMREKTETLGCGRTDTGVHASDFFAHFDSANDKLAEDKEFIYHLNCILPEDIAARNIFRVRPDAHARFDATSRTYHYHITHVKDPFLKDRAMLCRNNLDLEAMNRGSRILFEYSDFGCFSKNLTQVKTNICKIMEAGWIATPNGLRFHITADRFLRNMVRAIVGTLLEMGKGRLSETDLRRIIEGKNRSDAGSSVPACGLFLVNITYPPEIFE